MKTAHTEKKIFQFLNAVWIPFGIMIRKERREAEYLLLIKTELFQL